MGTFKKYNLIGGWLCFLIAAVVYLLSIEPTASLWDCAEFIATSYKLEVGHPPGAPLFMMLGRLFTIFTGPENAGMMVNVMSALASAATIMFLFWTITHLARRAYRSDEDKLSSAQIIAILGAGLIGATAYTFTDTFWFSAVEGEVYAMSSLFTAVVLWAILKWENVADQPHANRWLILIAYLTGLAIGVHLLNLLIIPAIVLIYYFKKYPQVTKWGLTKALLASFAMIVLVMFVLIPRTVQLGAFVDRIFVNSFGAGINVGFTIYVFLLFALLGWGVYYTHKKGRTVANTIILCTSVVMLGFSSYASVVIRASANPPMNSNNPSNPYGLLGLLNRDQYGSRPLLTGPYYSSPPVDYTYDDYYYVSEEDSTYKKATVISGYKFADGFTFLFPRMYERKQLEGYQNWVKIKGRDIPYMDTKINVPTFGENLQYFFGYQLNFMYWRYFLWNFVGRQSDIQSTGEITNGNWLSGIKPIDKVFLGPQDGIPSEMAANKGRNTYFFLPLILGLAGLVFQFNRDGKNFSVVMTVFIMTGLAVAVYLNSPPAEPRERDYVYAGSFYAFAIWIGFGVLALYSGLSRLIKKNNVAAAVAATVISACVPIILAAQNWDDHDRSGRYIARDFGENYLKTTLPNSIIMNYGDNDTFPLWYAQEVEGVRPDVRIMNMSYLGGEWYIDEMKRRYNESAPVPFMLPQSKYTYVNEDIEVVNEFKSMPIKLAMEYVASENERTKRMSPNGIAHDYIPSKTLLIPVNKQNVLESGIVKPEDEGYILDTLAITITKPNLLRNELMILDLLANFDWKRPLYFTATHPLKELGLQDYLQLDGFAYRLVPIKTPATDLEKIGRIDADYLYNNLMNEYRYGGFGDPDVYADFFSQLNFNSVQGRNLFARLANELTAKGDTLGAIEVLDRSLEEIPVEQIRHSYVMTIPVIKAYYNAGATDKANALLEDYASSLKEYIRYYLSFDQGNKFEMVLESLRENATLLFTLYSIAEENGQTELMKDLGDFLVQSGILKSADE